METITIQIIQSDVYEEVAKATDYTGSKLIDGDDNARERILAVDDDLSELSRFWEESVLATNENLKEMLVSGATKQIPNVQVLPGDVVEKTETLAIEDLPSARTRTGYEAVIEVSKSFDKALTASVQSTLRSFFIATIIGYWFKFANKGESADYFAQAAEFMTAAERLLYSRRKPSIPKD